MTAEAPEDISDRRDEEEAASQGATGLAIVAAGAAILGFVSFFRLTSDYDQTRARLLRRLLGVQVESLTGLTLGLVSVYRLRNASTDRRGMPFAVAAVVLATSNLVRTFRWLGRDR